MEIHHSRHHQTYVTSLNTASEKLATLQSSASASTPSSLAAQLALQPLIRFHAGGHVNHSLFWENLAPASQGGGEAKGPVVAEIERVWGGMGVFKKEFEGVLAGVQGSGWAWLVKEGGTGGLRIVARANQDVVGAGLVPLLGVDAWEHAY